MSNPIGQHYLPKNAYLKFFTSPDKEGFVWMYQRGKEPILASIENVGKENHLYSFTDEKGQYNFELEKAFSEMEQLATPVIQKFNDANGAMTITEKEKTDFGYFLAMQAIRTPASRKLLKTQASALAKLEMQVLASNKNALEKRLERVRKDNPDVPKISVEKMQEFIMSDRYGIEWGNENYFLKQAVEQGDVVYPMIMMKELVVLKSSFEIITCDYPVLLIPDPDVPPIIAGGFTR